MTPEERTRLESLLKGPWVEIAAQADQFFRPPPELLSSLNAKREITKGDLEAVEKQLVSPARRKTIARTLRAHWDDQEGITDQRELELRDSFDEVLTLLQLLELSIETAYLPEAAVLPMARERLLGALWSASARKFAYDYDYFAVRLLAARCKIDLGFSQVDPPAPNPAAQVQFATFLSQHWEWYDDEDLDWWLGLLDDYVAQDNDFDEPEAAAFYTFLRTGKLTGKSREVERRFYERANGLKRFLLLLAGLFSSLPEGVTPIYGSFYLYWMAKFFGYQMTSAGYRRERNYRDWSRVVAGPILCPANNTEEKLLQQNFVTEQVYIIQVGFEATRDFVKGYM
jgi:hypothetical protein